MSLFTPNVEPLSECLVCFEERWEIHSYLHAEHESAHSLREVETLHLECMLWSILLECYGSNCGLWSASDYICNFEKQIIRLSCLLYSTTLPSLSSSVFEYNRVQRHKCLKGEAASGIWSSQSDYKGMQGSLSDILEVAGFSQELGFSPHRWMWPFRTDIKTFPLDIARQILLPIYCHNGCLCKDLITTHCYVYW